LSSVDECVAYDFKTGVEINQESPRYFASEMALKRLSNSALSATRQKEYKCHVEDFEAAAQRLRNQLYDYCEWMEQPAFSHPHWQENRKPFLNENWNSYLDFTFDVIGNPFAVENDDLERVLQRYQHHSYLNSLKRVFSGLISQEFVENEKIIWTGIIEDSGEKINKSMGHEGRKASTHYLLLTERSLSIKSSNKSLTQKFPIEGLELTPYFNQGIRIRETVTSWEQETHDMEEAFAIQATVNGCDIVTSHINADSHLYDHQYSDVFLKMISAFAVAAHLFDLKMEMFGNESGEEVISQDFED